jgi:hypothetical protein
MESPRGVPVASSTGVLLARVETLSPIQTPPKMECDARRYLSEVGYCSGMSGTQESDGKDSPTTTMPVTDGKDDSIRSGKFGCA